MTATVTACPIHELADCAECTSVAELSGPGLLVFVDGSYAARRAGIGLVLAIDPDRPIALACRMVTATSSSAAEEQAVGIALRWAPGARVVTDHEPTAQLGGAVWMSAASRSHALADSLSVDGRNGATRCVVIGGQR